MRFNSLSFRLATGAGIWSTAALVVVGVLLSTLFRDYVERSFDARLNVLLQALVAASATDKDGRLTLTNPGSEPRFNQPYGGWYWQVEEPGGRLLRSRSLWDEALPATQEVATEPASFAAQGPMDQGLQVLVRDITLPETIGVFRYAVAGDGAEMKAEIRRFNGILLVSLGALGVGLLGAVLIQVRHGLRPLRRISQALSNIRSGRTERLEGHLPAEIMPLADELNALIDHNAAVVERARSHVGNLAHALKTPLSVLSNESGGVEGTLGDVVRRQTVLMRRHVDHYLVRARAAGSGGIVSARTNVGAVVDDLRRTLLRIHADRDIRIDVSCPEELTFRGESQDLEEIVGNLTDNACKWAGTRVFVEVEQRDGRLWLRVEDDGPGLPEGLQADVVERGKRLDESMPGSGLGLSIVRDIAELYGGGISLSGSRHGGLAAEVELPAAPSAG